MVQLFSHAGMLWGELCSKPSHFKAKFNLSKRLATFVMPDLYIVASDMAVGWDARSYGYGKKEYYANSNLC
ncbi:hypothetical protein DSO57_1035101 [Entomophthora muscae]|uniref:Uncharacterized protein n=1 Tax=Entomophthora muscae TaxID=34485 RepID=A0ACC2SCQ8_9FUNG|nr:hypothetical protein DSO57_1035101 [Entomophthora muscae]